MANYAPDAPAVKPTAQPTMHAAAAGDSFDNNGRTLLLVRNGSGAPITVTITDQASTGPAGNTAFDANVAVSVTNAQDRVIGPFSTVRFNDANGRVQLAWSATTSVTWAALRLE